MSVEQQAPPTSAPASAPSYETVEAADAAEQMTAATTALRSRLPLIMDAQPADPYPR